MDRPPTRAPGGGDDPPPAYPAARAVSSVVRAYFAGCVTAARDRGERDGAALPDERAIEEIIGAAFWASLRREEGRSPKISFAYLPPEHPDSQVMFGRPLPLDPGVLAKLSPAVERPGIHLGVCRVDGALRVWGAAHRLPPHCFVLEVVEPGLLVVKRRRRREDDKYANVVVLQGDQVKVVDQSGSALADRLPAMASSLGFASSRVWADRLNVAVQLALSMRAHGRGGSLLIVPRGSDGWRESVVQPILYPADPPFVALARLLERGPQGEEDAGWRDRVRTVVDGIAGLTMVDGATVITDAYELLAFGVKIRRRAGSPQVERVVSMEPVLGATATEVEPSGLGGTRHLSAAQFVQDQPQALALVASQDGRFTVFGCPPGQGDVHAHRVEALLL
ncbi:MAG: hypothetical protein H6Q10_1850 [Acidobacteria bacterium]|nr:hypothetical protein [Acidobacteriota bacterium]